jgi:cell wall-associated NlpC family hydrolase
MKPIRTVVLFFLIAVTAACTPVGSLPIATPGRRTSVPEELPPPSAFPAAEADLSSGTAEDVPEIVAGVVETALGAIGTPYKWGGTDANGFDCSGLIQYSYAQFGIALPRVSREQVRYGSSVALDAQALRPGDVLGFSQEVGGPVSHVGLYVGKGRFIHSSSSGVRLSDIGEAYWQRHLVDARRMVRTP